LTQDGRNIGACNTVIVRKGPNGERILVGHNTECALWLPHPPCPVPSADCWSRAQLCGRA